jgi:hypothetical protein
VLIDGTMDYGIDIGSGTNAITNGLRFGSTGITTDLTLQNGETLDNDTDNTVKLGFGAAGGILNLTSATNSVINASARLDLQADGGAIDVNLAGGSTATGCTVANSTGNLTCTGNITGAATGTVGYWTRSGYRR